MLREMKEVNDISTVGELRRALASIGDDMPISDTFGDPITLELEKEPGTEEEVVTFR